MGYVLGIDLGTGSLKGILMDKLGNIIFTSSADYDLKQPKKGHMEQNPEDWIIACEQVLMEIKKNINDFSEKLEGISFSGQMHSLVLLDENNEVLRPAILWNDTRTTQECEQIMMELSDEFVNITSNIALEGFTLPKVLWIQKNEPAIWRKVRHMLLPKDYLSYWFTGSLCMDYSDASGTVMLDMTSNEWSDKILMTYDIPKEYLPKLVNSSDQVGIVNQRICSDLGITHEVKVFAGGADNACAAIGSGILDETIGMLSVGTSGVFLAYENNNHTKYDGEMHLFHHGIKDSYYSMGVTLAAGHSLNWFKETFANHLSFEELLSGLETSPIGSKGLIFTPYIVGERTPHRDSNIRGSFIGLDTDHNIKDITRSVIEGITFSLKDCQEKMTLLSNKKFNKIVSVGGGAKNKAWLQIQANIFNTTIVCLETEQGPGVGAAMIAALGLGWFDSMQDCAKEFVTYKDVFDPVKEDVEKYNEVFAIYKKVYPSTNEICKDLVEFSS